MFDFNIEPLLHWIEWHQAWAWPVIFLLASIESVFIVGLLFPGTVTMTGIGALIGAGTLPFWPACIAAALGAFFGDALSFWLGYCFSDTIKKHPLVHRYRQLLIYGEIFFERHGSISVFFGRFIGPLRPIIATVAGLVKMNPKLFMVMNIASAIVWAPAYLTPGILLGASIDKIGGLSPEWWAFLVGIIPASAFIIVFRRPLLAWSKAMWEKSSRDDR
jgi:undecaprenyl-diphosphatase